MIRPSLDHALAIAALALTGVLPVGEEPRTGGAGSTLTALSASPPAARPSGGAPPRAPETPRDLASPDRESTGGGADPSAGSVPRPVTGGNPRDLGVAPQGDAAMDPDRYFVDAAARDSLELISAAREALAQARRADVRTTAQLLLAEQLEVRRRLELIAHRKGWRLAPDAEGAEPGADGDADRRFVELQGRALARTVERFREHARRGVDPELLTYARATLPALEHELELVRALRRNTSSTAADAAVASP
jgi:predicted outer membrane protein